MQVPISSLVSDMSPYENTEPMGGDSLELRPLPGHPDYVPAEEPVAV